MVTVITLPPQDRPREKLLKCGAEHLTNVELLALIIGSGSCGLSVLDIASNLLAESGSLRDLLEIDQQEFVSNKGVGEVAYCRIQAMKELATRHLYESISNGDTMDNPTITRQFLISKLRHLRHEVFAVLFLDNAHRVIHYETLFHGTINGASVYPRRVLERAMAHNCAAVILAHNHPSGVAEPSQADTQITETLKKTLAMVDIRVLDHFVIGEAEAVSFAERGLI